MVDEQNTQVDSRLHEANQRLIRASLHEAAAKANAVDPSQLADALMGRGLVEVDDGGNVVLKQGAPLQFNAAGTPVTNVQDLVSAWVQKHAFWQRQPSANQQPAYRAGQDITRMPVDDAVKAAQGMTKEEAVHALSRMTPQQISDLPERVFRALDGKLLRRAKNPWLKEG